MKNKPRIAVVLGGGGLKPLAALPLFEFLDQNGIREDFLVGCSGGGMIAALRAMGYSIEEIRDLASQSIGKNLFKRDIGAIMGALMLPFGKFDETKGFLKGKALRQLCHDLFGDVRMEALPTPLILQATEFASGEGLALQNGSLADAIYATMALFPFFPPFDAGDKLLIDGLYSSPMPVMQAVTRNADVIITVDFLEKIEPSCEGIVESMQHLHKLFTQAVMRAQMSCSVLTHHYEIIYVKVQFKDYMQLWDTEKVPEIYDAGVEAVAKYGSEIMDAVSLAHEEFVVRS